MCVFSAKLAGGIFSVCWLRWQGMWVVDWGLFAWMWILDLDVFMMDGEAGGLGVGVDGYCMQS